MPDGYRHGAHSGCVIGGSGSASLTCVRPPSAIYPGVRATRCHSGLCGERCHSCAIRPDGYAKHGPCRHVVWQDVCVDGRQALLLKGRPQAGGRVNRLRSDCYDSSKLNSIQISQFLGLCVTDFFAIGK